MAKASSGTSIDFFISYATPDEAMAKEIGAILDEVGYTYVAQFRDFPVGTNFVHQVQDGLAASSRLIALLSPHYERSAHCRAEWSAAFAQDPSSERGKIIPFKIAEVELNRLSSQIVNRSLVGLNAAERRTVVIEALEDWVPAPRRGTILKDPATAAPKPDNLPSSIGPLFKGREKFLDRLRESFRHREATAIVGKAVHGLGGVGKTRTAIEYGHACAADYSATFFLIGKSESDLRDSLAALAGAAVLDLPEKDVPHLEARVAAVIRWLRANPGWLLIIDNVDDEPAAKAAREFLDQVSRAGGHVLITSRVSAWGQIVEPLELDLLSLEAAKELLRESTPHRTKREDEDEALTRLAEEQLGCLSLALVQAAAYIEERRISFAQYCALFEREATKLLAKLGDAAMRNLGYRLPIALTWQTSIAQLSEAGRLLLDMLAWLSIEPIPRSLFDVWPETKTVDLEEGLAELTRYNFVHWEADNSAIAVHRLVALLTRDNLDARQRDRALQTLFAWLYEVNPEMNAGDARCWPQLLPLLPHVLLLFERTNDLGPYTYQTGVYRDYATLLQSLARYSEAEPMFRSALAIGEVQFGPNHPRVATCLNNLANLLHRTSRSTEAEALFRRSCSIHEAYYGPGHTSVMIDLNNLANLLENIGNLSDAESLYRRAVEIGEANLGRDPRVAICLSNFAALLCTTSRFAEAEPLYRRAILTLLRFSKGSGHILPDTEPTLQNYVAASLEAGRTPDEVSDVIASIMAEADFDPAAFPSRVSR